MLVTDKVDPRLDFEDAPSPSFPPPLKQLPTASQAGSSQLYESHQYESHSPYVLNWKLPANKGEIYLCILSFQWSKEKI